jgi:tetratricopeptide (TPR) repeat protein
MSYIPLTASPNIIPLSTSPISSFSTPLKVDSLIPLPINNTNFSLSPSYLKSHTESEWLIHQCQLHTHPSKIHTTDFFFYGKSLFKSNQYNTAIKALSIYLKRVCQSYNISNSESNNNTNNDNSHSKTDNNSDNYSNSIDTSDPPHVDSSSKTQSNTQSLIMFSLSHCKDFIPILTSLHFCAYSYYQLGKYELSAQYFLCCLRIEKVISISTSPYDRDKCDKMYSKVSKEIDFQMLIECQINYENQLNQKV